MFINFFKSFSNKILFHKIYFRSILIFFLLFSLSYSFPKILEQNTLPTKYFKKIKTREIEEKADLYLLSTRDGYLHALNNEKEEIWKAYLDQELMTSTLTARQITQNISLFPFNEQIYFIENGQIKSFDTFIKNLVERKYTSYNNLTLTGKTKTTIFIIDIENGEILQKIDEDSNFISNKKIYILQKNRRKKTITVLRVDHILNCLGLKEGEKYWNASYSDILIKKGNENDNLDLNNFFINFSFMKKIVNDYKIKNLDNYEISNDNLITAYAYFDREDIPNIKIYDRSISQNNLNLEQQKEMNEEIKYLNDYYKFKRGNYLIDENYKAKKEIFRIINYIQDNYILILIIIMLCFIIFFILSYYNRKIEINNNINKEINIEKQEEKPLIEKNENSKEEINNLKHSNIEKEDKENTNITEESKDYFADNKKEKEEIEEIKELISEKKEIIISKENKNNSKKSKEKSGIKNSIWDSDDEDEEKSKTKSQIKIKEKKEDNDEESDEEDEEESDENKNEILNEISKNKDDDESNGNIIFEIKHDKKIQKIKKKTRLDTDFENLEKIGEGGYGLVLKGTHRIDKYIYAIKIINISDFKNKAEIDEIVNEANKMSMIKDKYIVNYNICWYEDNLGSAEKFYEKKEEEEEESISKNPSKFLQDDKEDDKNSIKSNNSTKLNKKESKLNRMRSLYCTSFRDDSKLINTSILSMKYKKKFFVILMEYCDGNTLEDLITKHIQDSKPIDRRLIYNYIKQILKGLKVLHRNGIIHSDIKPGNIFLKKVGEIEQIKIGDFGMAMIKKGSTRLKSEDLKGFTPLYSAPEQKNRKGTYNEKIDIYACGLILYELIGCFETNAEKYKAFDILKSSGTILDYIEKKYKEESDLIKIMTKKDYDERPSAEEILGNSIFKELGKILNK